MRDRTIELLQQQLRAALEDEASGAGDAVEVAVLCGLLDRFEQGSEIQQTAEQWRDGGGADRIAQRLTVDLVESVVEGVALVDDDMDDDETAQPLLELDELCAAATWVGCEDAVRAGVDLAARTIEAFPEPWQSLSGFASRVLESAPPRPGDPMTQVWSAVEIAELGATEGRARDERAEPESLPFDLLLRLGLVRSIAIGEFSGLSLAASEAVPDEPTWIRVAHGRGWELALTEDEEGAPIIVVAASEQLDQPVFQRDGEAVEPSQIGAEFRCPAVAGAWSITIAEKTVEFEITS